MKKKISNFKITQTIFRKQNENNKYVEIIYISRVFSKFCLCCISNWKNKNPPDVQLSERLAHLGNHVLGVLYPLKPLGASRHYRIEGLTRGPHFNEMENTFHRNTRASRTGWDMSVENRHRQTYSCPRDLRLSASGGPN